MKKFKLLGFTLLASSLALSSCMLLPKKKTDTGSSSDTGSGSDTPAVTDWTDAVKDEMKKYLDGEVIPFISGSWTWEYQSDYGCYCGTSKDTKPATAVAAFESGWNKSLDENEGMLSKIHQKGAITIELYDDDGTTTLDCYFDEEASGYSSETEASMVENFGEALPFPAGTWAGPYATWYGAYYLQSAHSYNYSSIKSSYESKGYTFYIDEEDNSEYFYKQTSLGYICGWLKENTDLKLGYVYFYFTDEPPVSGTFELKSNKTTALTGENVTLTIERDNVDVETVTYTVSPASAVTEVSKDNNGAVYTINVTEKTEITFTAKQGEDYESSVKVTAYKEYPKPTSIAFKKSSYSVDQGKSIDLSDEITVLPEDATGYTLSYTKTEGNAGVSVTTAGVVSATPGASTSQTATIKVSYSDDVYATCTVSVTEPIISVEDVVTSDNYSEKAISGYQNLSYTSQTSSVVYSGFLSVQKNSGTMCLMIRRPSTTTGGYSALTADGGSKKCVDVTVSLRQDTQKLAVYGSDSPITLTDLESFNGNVKALGEIDNTTPKYTFTTQYRYVVVVPPKGGSAAEVISLTFNWA